MMMVPVAPAKRRRAGSRAVPGYNNMTYLASSVGLWGPAVLDRLPHAFDTRAAGQGQQWWKNKRVLIIIAVLFYLLQRKELKWRIWTIPLAALLGQAVIQHKMMYMGEEQVLVESYEQP